MAETGVVTVQPPGHGRVTVEALETVVVTGELLGPYVIVVADGQ